LSAAVEALVFACNLVFGSNSMPVMTGPMATLQLRTMGYSGIILGVTGNAAQEDVNDFKHKGADLVIIKPLDASKFDSALKDLAQIKNAVHNFHAP
jgi:CheY-like chemotaxis protein